MRKRRKGGRWKRMKEGRKKGREEGDRETSCVYQSEGSEHGQPWQALEPQLGKREEDDDEVEDVPAILEVLRRSHGQDLEERFGSENRGEHLYTATRITSRIATQSSVSHGIKRIARGTVRKIPASVAIIYIAT